MAKCNREQIESRLQEYGYTLVGDYNGISSYNILVDSEGFYYYTTLSNLFSHGGIPKKFTTSNKFTIDNIHTYITKNNIDSQLVSIEYKNNSSPLDFICGCGRKFSRSWSNFLQGSNQCSYCRRSVVHKDIDKIQTAITQKGFILLEDLLGKQSNDTVDVIDMNGYKYRPSIFELYRIRENGQYNNHYMIHQCNPFAIDNINTFFLNHNTNYQCTSDTYVDNTSSMSFRHISCGGSFISTWAYMSRMVKNSQLGLDKCPICKDNKTESYHALVLKQIFQFIYPDTIVEDCSCINPYTNKPLPTDIVNHRLKIAIEIQSDYHDKDCQKKRDVVKKHFWIDKGYDFYNPDIRDYSIIKMIQLFFPQLQNIPSYVDMNYSDCIKYNEVQQMLDNGYSIKAISSQTAINAGTIRSAIRMGKINLPSNYKSDILNYKAIVQLDDLGHFVQRFDTLAEANRKGYARGNIQRVLRGEQKMAYQSYWIYEQDYTNGQYVLSELSNRYIIPVDKFDTNGNFIKSYPNIYRAEKDSVSNKSEILRIISSNNLRKVSRGEVWKIHNQQ